MRRAWRVTAALALLLSSASILLSVYLFDQIQQERVRAIETNCRSDSAQNQAILDFIERRSTPEAVAQAHEYFPVLTDRECRAQAARRVNP